MLGFLPPFVRGAIAFVLLVLNTLFWCTVLFAFSLLKLLLPFRAVRMRIDPSLGLIPEISGHRLMVSIRLMRQDEDGRLKPAPVDATFELTLCS